jgi:hypothetical protein
VAVATKRLATKKQPLPAPPTTPVPEQSFEDALTAFIGSCTHDPLRFVMGIFPWREKGTDLEPFTGPDEWQTKILRDIRDGLLTIEDAIRVAVASGHGIGKSALVSWIVLWAMSSKDDTKGVVTANTESQLKTKTWAELAKWHRLSLNMHWFEHTATALISTVPGHEKTWRIDMVPWSEKNTEAFAGLHNKFKRVLLIFDEASAIPDTIWEVADGALTDSDTEILQFAFGNPTRAKGAFRDCFRPGKKSWKTYQIDSRTAAITNKKFLQSLIDEYGIDSDRVKVRVLGQFPSQDVSALFSDEEVEAAMTRVYTEREITHAAKVLGVDVARQGGDDSVICKRQGVQMYPLEPMHIPDTQLVAAKVVAAEQNWEGCDGSFIDATGGYGVGVIDAARMMGHQCTEVYFNGKATDERYFNKRSEMAFELHNWVKRGGALPRDQFLKEELLAITYTYQGDKFRICDKDDIKEEIGRSPDRADAAMLTFAYAVAPKPKHDSLAALQQKYRQQKRKTLDYDPLEVI